MLALLAMLSIAAPADDLWVTLPGKDANSKHIVLISGDEEYRSEDTLSQLARILNTHHGFKCTVLFAIDPATGTVNPNKLNNIPGLTALKTADLMVLFTRYRNLPDDQMQSFVDYLESGRPIVGLRTATHAFNNLKGKFAYMNAGSKEKGWEGGFGKTVLGETWVDHHGVHRKEGTRGRIVKGCENNPILKGIEDGSIFAVTDVYKVNLPLAKECEPLLMGEVTETLKPDSPAIAGKKNDPMMPIAWTKTYKSARIFTTTMGCSQDLENEAFRRLLVNACYWAMGIEDKIAAKSNVEIVGVFEPKPFGTKKDDAWKPGKKPAEYFK